MSEEGWKGVDLSGHLDQLHRNALEEVSDSSTATRLAERGIVVLDEFDKLRVHPTEQGSSRSQHVGKQQSILQLWGGGSISVNRIGGALEWDPSKTLVVGCGVFEDLDAPNPTTGDFVEWGLMPELADRIARGTILRLSPLTQRQTEAVLRLELEEVDEIFGGFGFRLVVTDAALSMVAAALGRPEQEAGIRAGMGWLHAACESALVRMLEDGAPVGSSFQLTPDEIRIPDPPTHRWWGS